MRTVTGVLHGLAWSVWLGTALAAEDLSVPPPMPAETPSTPSTSAKHPPPTQGACSNCGVIRSIEQTETERQQREMPSYIASQQYNDQRDFSKAYVGPVLGITFGKGQSTQTFVGAAGSEAMRQRFLQITYAVTVSFDDGRFGLIEVPDIDNLRVGDRVRVDGSRLEPVKGKE